MIVQDLNFYTMSSSFPDFAKQGPKIEDENGHFCPLCELKSNSCIYNITSLFCWCTSSQLPKRLMHLIWLLFEPSLVANMCKQLRCESFLIYSADPLWSKKASESWAIYEPSILLLHRFEVSKELCCGLDHEKSKIRNAHFCGSRKIRK